MERRNGKVHFSKEEQAEFSPIPAVCEPSEAVRLARGLMHIASEQREMAEDIVANAEITTNPSASLLRGGQMTARALSLHMFGERILRMCPEVGDTCT